MTKERLRHSSLVILSTFVLWPSSFLFATHHSTTRPNGPAFAERVTMKVFHCDHCQQLVFFENVQCVNCEHPLAYLPDIADMGSLEPAGEDLWRTPQPRAEGRAFRLCRNYSQENVCNWAVADEDPNPLCRSCRLTRVIP